MLNVTTPALNWRLVLSAWPSPLTERAPNSHTNISACYEGSRSEIDMIRALDRVSTILDCFSQSGPSLSAAEIADRSGLDRATTLRFLRAMEQRRMVRRDPFTKRYSPGSRLIQWGMVAASSIDVRIVAEPVMQRLNEQTGETIALYVRAGDRRVCVASRESPHEIRHVLPIGNTLRMAEAAGGHAMLAALPETEARQLIADDPELTESERELLPRELLAIRERGYALGIRLMTPHAWSMGAPILDRTGGPVAVLVISGPDVRISDEIAEQHGKLLVPAAREISEALGAPAEAIVHSGMETRR